MERLLPIYALYAATEGNSKNSIAIVTASVRYLEEFLASRGASTDVRDVTHLEVRAFILHLREKRRFQDHPFTPPRSHVASRDTPSIPT